MNSLSRKVSKLKLQREVKEFVAFGVGINPDVNGIVGQFGTAIQAGTGHNERVGREIVPVRLTGRAIINGPSTATAAWIPYRFVVFQDKQGVSTPLSSELFTGTSAAGAYDIFNATYNTDYVAHPGDRNNRYKILYDKMGFMSPRSATIPFPKPAMQLKFTIPASKLDVVNYADQTSGGARSGKIWYYFVGGLSSVVAENSTAILYQELDFTDS